MPGELGIFRRFAAFPGRMQWQSARLRAAAPLDPAAIDEAFDFAAKLNGRRVTVRRLAQSANNGP
jgi:hypothetical protein